MTGEITGDGVRKARDLAAKLKTADPLLKRELRRALKDAAAPAAAAARASILAMPAKRIGDPPLRAAAAASVTVRATLTRSIQVSIVAEPSKMPPGEGSLPAYLNDQSWRHPVFGNRKVWRSQRGKPGWFDGSILRAGPEAQANISDAMDITADYITGAL